MVRKLILCLLIVAHGVLLFPDVFAKERDPQPASTVVAGSFVKSAIRDITTWMIVPREWAMEQMLAMKPAPELEEPLPIVAPEPPAPIFAYSDLVLEVADKHGVDWRLVASVIAVESSFNPKAVSEKGARGLMQVMPTTAALYRIKGAQLFDPRSNIEAGVQHLRMLTDRYPGQLEYAVAAYNSGEGAVDKYHGIPPYKPTRVFVRRVMTRYQNHLTLNPPAIKDVAPDLHPAAAF